MPFEFRPLNTPLVPTNALAIDFSPIRDAIDTHQKQERWRTEVDFRRAAEQRADKQLGFAAEAAKREAELHPLAKQAREEELSAAREAALKRRSQIVDKFLADVYDKLPEEQRPGAWEKFRASPIFAKDAHLFDGPFGGALRDPKIGRAIIGALASKYRDELDTRVALSGALENEASANLKNRQAASKGAVGYENMKQLADVTEGMRKEFTALPTVKNYIDADSAANRLKSLVEKSKEKAFGSGAGDIAMVFSFIKALDPTSVVQPGEQATARNAPGVTDQLLNTYNRILNGEFLTPATRGDFLKVIESELAHRKAPAVEMARRYRTIARESSVNPDHVVPRVFGGIDLDGDGRPDTPQRSDVQPFQPRQATPGPATQGRRAEDGVPEGSPGSRTSPVYPRSPQDAEKLPPGTYFYTPDGRLKVR